MNIKRTHKTIIIITAIVWIINGLFCKVLNLVPRHEQIVSRIIGIEYSKELTIAIGLFEIAMALWILSSYKPKINAIVQIIIVLTMNVIEFSLASDLLLWGKYNILFALLFIVLVYYNEFILNKLKTT